jgi:hypothetical protein
MSIVVDDPTKTSVSLRKKAGSAVHTLRYWNFDDSDGAVFAHEAHLEADDVQSLRDWYASRVDELDRELEAERRDEGDQGGATRGVSWFAVRIDSDTAEASFRDLGDYVEEHIREPLARPYNKNQSVAVEVALEARDIRTLRNFHVARVDALNRGLEFRSEGFIFSSATEHEELIVQVLNRLGEAREVDLPLAAEQIEEARRAAVESPTIARVLRDYLDEDMALHRDPERKTAAADWPERDVVAGLAEVGRQVDRARKDEEADL